MLRLLFYENQFTSISEAMPAELSWDEFVEEVLRKPELVATKGSETQYFPGEFKPDAKSKGDSDVLRIHLFCLDVDGIADEALEEVCKAIEAEGLEAVLHSTHSQLAQRKQDGTNRIRIVFPTSRPILPEEHRLVWANMRLAICKQADLTTAHPSKHFLVPSQPPGDEAERARIYREFRGKPLDVDDMLSRYGLELLAESEMETFELGRERITETMFTAVVTKRRKAADAPTVHALKLALSREPYAETGAREDTLFKIAGLLAKEFPRGNPDDLCEPLRYSIEYEEKQGGPKFSEFRDKVIRRQRDLLRRAAQKTLANVKEAARVASEKEKAVEYTPQNLAEYFKRSGGKVDLQSLKKQLILVHRNNYYVFNGRTYVFATATSLLATVREHLLHRAERYLDFSYYYPVEAPDKPPEVKSADHFVRDHGRVVEDVRYNYRGSSYFDRERLTLHLSEVESPTRLVPQRSVKVEKWMRALTGNDLLYHKLEQYFAQFSNTEQPLVTLAIFGPSGIGKSALAEGLARMFGRAPPCSMENYFSSFNSQVLSNPLVFADETMPLVNGKVPTEKYRSMVSAGHHEVNRKGQPIVILDGHVRTIMAFQTLNKFDFGSNHEREDIEAIGKRVLFVQGREEAAERFDYEHMVEQDGLAKHALYLAQTISRAEPRFGVDTTGADQVITGDASAMAVLDWIYEYLAAKVYSTTDVNASAARKVPVLINKGRLFVNTTTLRKNWEDYAPNRKGRIPGQKEITQAVRSLSVSDEAVRIRTVFGDDSFWEIKRSTFASRMLALDLLDERQIELLFKIPHEIAYRTKSFELSEQEKFERLEALREFKGSNSSKESA